MRQGVRGGVLQRTEAIRFLTLPTAKHRESQRPQGKSLRSGTCCLTQNTWHFSFVFLNARFRSSSSSSSITSSSSSSSSALHWQSTMRGQILFLDGEGRVARAAAHFGCGLLLHASGLLLHASRKKAAMLLDTTCDLI